MFKIVNPVAFLCNAGMFKDNFWKNLWPQLPEIKTVRIPSRNHPKPPTLQSSAHNDVITPEKHFGIWDDQKLVLHVPHSAYYACRAQKGVKIVENSETYGASGSRHRRRSNFNEPSLQVS